MRLDEALNTLGALSGYSPREFSLRLMMGCIVKWRDPYHGVADLEGIVRGGTCIISEPDAFYVSTLFSFDVYDAPSNTYVDCGYCPLHFIKEQ